MGRAAKRFRGEVKFLRLSSFLAHLQFWCCLNFFFILSSFLTLSSLLRLSSFLGRLLPKVVFHLTWLNYCQAAPDALWTASKPMATLKTSPEANSGKGQKDRRKKPLIGARATTQPKNLQDLRPTRPMSDRVKKIFQSFCSSFWTCIKDWAIL